MDIRCSICGTAIGDTWVQIIVRDMMGDDFIDRVGFVDSPDCLTAYAVRVAKG